MEPLRALEQAFSIVEGREFRSCTIKVLRKVWVCVKTGDNGRHVSWWFLGFHMASWVSYRVLQPLEAPSGIWGTCLSALIQPHPPARNVLLACSFLYALHLQRVLSTTFLNLFIHLLLLFLSLSFAPQSAADDAHPITWMWCHLGIIQEIALNSC